MNMLDYRAPEYRSLPESNFSAGAWRVVSQQPVSYETVLCRNILSPANPALADELGADGRETARRLVVIDGRVEALFGDRLRDYAAAWKIDFEVEVISGDESNKALEQVVAVTEAMSRAKLNRRNQVVLAIGGGVVLDIVGLASSLYRRGIPYIRVPTTLMGIVDAGIGVKTGVNMGEAKNRVGTYFAPRSALLDPSFLRTIDQRHVANGVSEIVKMALVKDRRLFELLEWTVDTLTPATLAIGSERIDEILSRAIGGMLDELEPNLWESNLERIVDYGHTFSPSLELRAGEPPLLHGEAVAIDMALTVVLAHRRGLLTAEEQDRALDLLVRAGLPIRHPAFDLPLVAEALEDTTRHRDGLQRVPLTAGIGDAVFVNDLTVEELGTALEVLERRAVSVAGRVMRVEVGA